MVIHIENIEAFVYVIHYNSFHKAADALFLTQPSVTSRVQRLEKELNVALLTRQGKRFSLTEKGRLFLPYAQMTLQTYKKATQLVTENNREAGRNIIRLGSNETISHCVVPQLLPRLKEWLPHYQFCIVTDHNDAIVDKVLRKELDIGFVRHSHHPELDAVRLLEDPIHLCLYKGHHLESKESLSIRELEKESLVFYACGSLNWTKLHRLFDTLSHPPRIEYQIDNMEIAKKLVLQKQGISFLPALCFRAEVREGQLVAKILPDLAEQSLITDLIVRKGEHQEVYDAITRAIEEMRLIEPFNQF